MPSFKINGCDVASDAPNRKLLTFLREDLGLAGTKDGCSEGACGACTVLVDGKATRACVPSLAKLEGKSVVTIEGLTAREKAVYSYSFAKAGAVQCGYCIPGMVMSAKALLDVNPDPAPADVKKAIRGNICRCTGYVKIEDAIMLAARLFREDAPVPQENFTGKLGEDFPRLDAQEKTLGTGLYVDDLGPDYPGLAGMLYATGVRSKYPRARVLGINASKALEHPDVVRVITADDIPGKKVIGHIVKDQPVLVGVGEITHFVGDAVALVVTRTREALKEALDLMEVEWEELPPVTSAAQALDPDSPRVHPNGNLLREEIVDRGDAAAAIAASRHVVRQRFILPPTDHAFMEPECAIGVPEGEDGILVYTGAQGIYDEQHELADMLNLPYEKTHIHSMLVGGGFGGKEDMSVQHHAALAAWIVKKPVKVKFSRQESLDFHPKRHAMEINVTLGCDENGIIQGADFDILSDTGSFASLGGPVLQRACTHAGGPYNFQNFKVRGRAMYTNNPPAGAFRGFGVTQSAFCMECVLTLLAEKAGISPWEIRYRNAVRPGQALPNGQIADPSTAVVECLEAVKESFDKAKHPGISACFKNSGVGVGLPDTGRCIASVEKGKIHLRSSAACIGQGMATVMLQMACESTGFPPDVFFVEPPDTVRTPNSGTTTASRQTVFTGEATVRATAQLKQALKEIIEEEQISWDEALQHLEGREFLGEFLGVTDPMGTDKPNPVSHVAYGYAALVVDIDDDGKILFIHGAYDAGRVANPAAAQGQLEGGIVMGMGYALTEDFKVENGYPKNKYGTLGLFRATDIPEIRTQFVDNKNWGPYGKGGKGVGELASIPATPAIHGAYYHLDGVFRTSLPLKNTFYKKAPKPKEPRAD